LAYSHNQVDRYESFNRIGDSLDVDQMIHQPQLQESRRYCQSMLRATIPPHN